MDHTDTSHDLTRVASTMSSLHPYAGTTASGSGRRPELAVIREHAERLATGNGALVMWFGPRGAGKTRLLHQATNVVTEVLPHVRTLHIPGDSLRTSTLAGVAGMLAHALDLPSTPDTELVDEVLRTRERRRINDAELLRAAYSIGRAATATRPVLVMVDDLPYFAVEDITELAMLAARIAELPLLIVCTSSYPLPADKSLSAFGPLWMHRLEPLSDAEAWSIALKHANGFIPPVVAARINRRGAGLPGDVAEIVRTLSPTELRGELPLPDPVRLSGPTLSAVREWLGDLGGQERLLVVCAALASFGNLDVVEAAAGVPMEAAGQNPDDRWFEADGANFTFADERRRAAVRTVAARRDVLGAHRALAAASPDGSASQAWNRLQAGEALDDDEITDLAALARRELEHGDLDLALTLARDALLAGRAPALRSGLSLVAGVAAMHAGYTETAYEELSAAVSSAADDETLAHGAIGLILTVTARDGSLPTSIIDAAIARLRVHSPHLAVCIASIAARHAPEGGGTGASASATALLALAEELASGVTEAEALSGLAFTRAYLGTCPGEEQPLPDVLSPSMPRTALLSWDRALCYIELLMRRGETDAALMAISDVRYRLARNHSPLFAARLTSIEIELHLILGNVQKAAGIAREAMFTVPLHLAGAGMGIVQVAEALTLVGDTEPADQWVEAARLAGHAFPASMLRARVPLLLSLRAGLDGDLQTSAEQLTVAAQHFQDLGAPPWHRAFVSQLEIRFTLGREISASTLLNRIDEDLAGQEDPDPEAVANRAIVHALLCGPDEVVAAVRECTRAAESVHSPLSRALFLLSALRLLGRRSTPEQHEDQQLRLGDPAVPADKAGHLALLTSLAASAAEESGARALSSLIRSFAASASAQPVYPASAVARPPSARHLPAPTAPPVPGGDVSGQALTAEERTVAQMVVAGASNKQVAAALYVSVRTVELRLTSIYRKLGISSRKELPRAMSTRESQPAGPAPYLRRMREE